MASFLVNGRATPSVHAADRGLMYGDGVFRTLLTRSGRPLNWGHQYRLLARDCALLGLPCPGESLLLEEIARVAPRDSIAKVMVTRGAAGRGYAWTEDFEATRVVAAWPEVPATPEAAADGVRVRRCDLALAIQPRLAGVKSLNRLENVLARAEWHDPAVREGLLADTEGRLVEGTMSNIFLSTGGALVTPSLARCGVEGSQRARVLELAAADGIACEVRDATFDELDRADEVFLTNSVIGLWPVAAFGGRRWAPGPLARRLQRLLEEHDARAA
jgi:4-amino-4-deoxychorismate lyase